MGAAELSCSGLEVTMAEAMETARPSVVAVVEVGIRGGGGVEGTGEAGGRSGEVVDPYPVVLPWIFF